MNENLTSEEILTSLDCLDSKTGLLYFGNDPDLYVETIRVYAQDRLDEDLAKSFEEADWATYQRTAHSIKSSSNMIGATALFEEAKKLEAAAKDQDIDFIKANHQKLMDDYVSMVEKLSSI